MRASRLVIAVLVALVGLVWAGQGANLIGGSEGQGFKHIMTGLESERINVAARGVGLARAAFEDAICYAQQRHTFGKPICEHQTIQIKLADMATKIEAARLLVYSAAEKKDRGERCDLEAGMAKLFATETAQEVALEALRIHGGAGYSKDFNVERYYRDAPLLIVGGGTPVLAQWLLNSSGNVTGVAIAAGTYAAVSLVCTLLLLKRTGYDPIAVERAFQARYWPSPGPRPWDPPMRREPEIDRSVEL